MKKYLVSYDLLDPGRDYDRLINELRRLGGQRVLLSQWVVVITLTTAQLRDHLMQFIDSNDRLLVNDFYEWASWKTLIKLSNVKAA